MLNLHCVIAKKCSVKFKCNWNMVENITTTGMSCNVYLVWFLSSPSNLWPPGTPCNTFGCYKSNKEHNLLHHFGGMLAWKSGLSFLIRALKVPFSGTWKWALLPKWPFSGMVAKGRQGSPMVAKGFQGPRGTPGMGEMSYNQIDHI